MKISKRRPAKAGVTIRQQEHESCCTPPEQTSSCFSPTARQSTSGCCESSAAAKDKAPCCGPATVVTGGEISEHVPGFMRWLETPAGRVPQISAELTLSDHIGACKARWAMGRMSYIVPPGLYAIGTPEASSPVVVTANYKMSYDIVRQQLKERNLWLLVLETFGVNVWCAAGKGSFGTDELVSRINRTDLHDVVSHRELILPILGAPGVAAHQVAKRTGFHVRYGTIRAADLPEYLDNGMRTTPAMREITFNTYERLVLVPVELVLTMRSIALFGGLLFLATMFVHDISAAITAFAAYVGAVLTGIAAVPILLPWIPGRSFALKGAIAGLSWCTVLFLLADGRSWQMTTTLASFLALPAISAYYGLNFTGCTTYTSRSGVKKEMRLSIPAMGAAIAAAVLLLLAGYMV